MRTRFRLCKYCGDFHNVAMWPDNHRDPEPARSELPSPYFISDTMDALFHPSDNRMYDSKTAFRQTTEAYGGIEMGTEQPEDRRWADTVTPEEVNTARQMVDQGYVPHPEQATADEMQDVIA